MRRSHIRLLTKKTRKVFDLLAGTNKNDTINIRKENIKYIFSNSLQLMEDVIKEYDYSFDIFKSHSQAKLVVIQKFSMPDEQVKAVERAQFIFDIYNLDIHKLKLQTT